MATTTASGADASPRTTERDRRKADRRAAILHAAAALFAERGYAGVTIEDLGQAAGVSGPALYRHFPGKASVLAHLLVDASRGLLDRAESVRAASADPTAALASLIAHHAGFALAEPDVIVVQDRELARLDDEARHEVRALQRAYVEHWVAELARLRPDVPEPELRVRVHAAFGLLNSTPHSARLPGRRPAQATTRGILEGMAWAALTA